MRQRFAAKLCPFLKITPYLESFMSDKDELSTLDLEQVFVARQPIFTTNMNIWGYELLFRHSSKAQAAIFTDCNKATAQVITDGFAIANKGLPSKIRMCVNFSKQMILDDIPYSFPNGQVIELLEDIIPDNEFVEKCLELKKSHLIAVDDYTGQKGWEKILKLANIIKVDVLNLTEKDLDCIIADLQTFQGKLLAEKVEDQSMFSFTKKLGFHFFQGFFFGKPQVVKSRKLSSNEMARLQILNELGQKEISQKRLNNIIQSDISITYRLLTYINSPGFDLINKVSSIEHALKMLGENMIRQWLRVLIIADFDTTPKGQEVIQISATRAFFLKNLTQFYTPPLVVDSLFTIGLLSMIDTLLNQPIAVILEQIPLQDEIKDVLVGKDSEATNWLILAKYIEAGQWQKVDQLSQQVGFTNEKLAQAYSRAMIQISRLL